MRVVLPDPVRIVGPGATQGSKAGLTWHEWVAAQEHHWRDRARVRALMGLAARRGGVHQERARIRLHIAMPQQVQPVAAAHVLDQARRTRGDPEGGVTPGAIYRSCSSEAAPPFPSGAWLYRLSVLHKVD